MKVRIKEEGKTREFNLINKWSDVNLKSWTKLITKQNEKKGKQAKSIIAELSNIPEALIDKIELTDIALIMSKIGSMQQKKNSTLKRLIKIEGKEYGFHPDLESITLGEYADIETFVSQGTEKHLPEIMAILYRPVVEKQDNLYKIEAYDGDIKLRASQMNKMSAEQVQSALVFFYHFVKMFLTTMPSVLIDRLKETKQQ